MVSRTGIGNKVHFFGFIQYDELPYFYNHAKALILPSWSDQWGLVVNEAMACGLPVLVSEKCGCAPDLVVNGKNGFTFDPNDPEEFLKGMEKIIDLAGNRQVKDENTRLLNSFNLGTFSGGLKKCIELALYSPVRKINLPGRMMHRILVR
jgi:glycosyltransferase involved in cell wall biosynthesis